MAAGRPPSRESPTTACSTLQWIFARLLADAILLQPAVERAAAHAELLRREADIAIVPRQHLFDEDPFRFLEREVGGGGDVPGSARAQTEVARRDGRRRRIGHQHRALD